jgi:putative toxin-antitoxin system antitoxin component (TIGR02293 family)
MSKSTTPRHMRAAAPSATAVARLARAKRTTSRPESSANVVGIKAGSKPLHAKVRDVVAVRSAPQRIAKERVLESDLKRVVAQEVGRQLRQSGIVPIDTEGGTALVREVSAYAQKAFGDAAKANRWLARPSARLGGVRPIDYLASHDDASAVYQALDAIAYGAPL